MMSSSVAVARASLVALGLASVAAVWTRLAASEARPTEWVAASTSLRGRTSSQRHNAGLAAAALNRAIVMPGEVFSFNRRVRVWSSERGYLRAPVSQEGVLVRAVGGGVCQVSTTLYNAVLVAGLPIIERHRHAVAPGYVPPGRDAAVAPQSLDFRFRNTLADPIRIRAEVAAGLLTVRLLAGRIPRASVTILTRVLAVRSPRAIVAGGDDRANSGTPGRGAAGYRVVTYRCFHRAGREVRRERMSDDTYRAVDYLLEPTPQAGGIPGG